MTKTKTWTAADIKMGTIRMGLNGSVLSAIQGYSFVDAGGEEIAALPTGSVQISISFSDLPANIQQALSDINLFMYSKALQKEGMDE